MLKHLGVDGLFLIVIITSLPWSNYVLDTAVHALCILFVLLYATRACCSHLHYLHFISQKKLLTNIKFKVIMVARCRHALHINVTLGLLNCSYPSGNKRSSSESHYIRLWCIGLLLPLTVKLIYQILVYYLKAKKLTKIYQSTSIYWRFLRCQCFAIHS